eukprot:m.152073 g.152073  ORF g.152073 m.152073 type:complete len:113 (+) comp38585_c0_seq9:1475-1813(+)
MMMLMSAVKGKLFLLFPIKSDPKWHILHHLLVVILFVALTHWLALDCQSLFDAKFQMTPSSPAVHSIVFCPVGDIQSRGSPILQRPRKTITIKAQEVWLLGSATRFSRTFAE